MRQSSDRGQLVRAARFGRDPLEIRVDHHPDQPREIERRPPAQLRPRLRAVANQVLDLGGADETLVEPDVILPSEADAIERDLDEIAYGMALAGRDHEIVRGV